MSESRNVVCVPCPPKSQEEVPLQVRRRLERAALSPERQALVRGNLGLVHLHLNHAAAQWNLNWTDEERLDLVQEGCLGLIRAAQDFRPEGAMPFAAFALPRIHKAVSRALSLQKPDGPERAAIREAIEVATKRKRRVLAEDPLEALGDWHGTGGDTIGVRLRDKYDRAVQRGVEELLKEVDHELHRKAVRVLAEERHLVADLPARKPFRAIAAQVGLPYPRITQYDRQLRAMIARILSLDPEFAELQRAARTRSEGIDARADGALDARLARLGAAEFIQRVLNAPADRGGQAMTRLLEIARPTLLEAIRRELESLPAQHREELLSRLPPVAD